MSILFIIGTHMIRSTYTLSIVIYFMHNLWDLHMNATIHVLRYLKYASESYSLKIQIQRIDAYTDTNWIASTDDRRSMFGVLHLFMEKQETTRSSA